MDEHETLGSRLRELRVADPYLTLRQAAALLHSRPEWLSKVECDRLKPTPSALVDIARAYGADPADLILLWNRWQEAPPPDLTKSICTGRKR